LVKKQSNYDDLLAVLNKIWIGLNQINVKLEKLITLREDSQQSIKRMDEPLKGLDVMTLLALPDHLRKTAIILYKLGKASASQVSEESRRARAIESSYLNQLVVMGHVKKVRSGRLVYFYME
jgi:hypothetical protein